MVDLELLLKAIAQLEDALDFYNSEEAKTNPRLFTHLQAATIQAFEFTYELSFKTLRRFLQETESSSGEVDKMTFRDIIRLGYEREILKAELPEWEIFRRDRGTTSHAYDQQKAETALAGIPSFLKEVHYLIQNIKERQIQK